MFYELVEKLTKEQIDQLVALGVARSRVSEWRKHKGLPSRKAVIALAAVTKQDVMTLEKEVMLLESEPGQRDLFQQLIGLAASIFLVLGMFGAPSNANADQGSRPLTRGGHALYIVDSMLT